MAAGNTREPFAMVSLTALDVAAEIGTTAVAVLVALARYADRNRRCWPSVATIADKAGCKPRAARIALRNLEAAGVITTTRRYKRRGECQSLEVEDGNERRGEQGTNVYRINDRAGTKRRSPAAEGAAPAAGRVLQQVPGGDGIECRRSVPTEPDQMNQTKANGSAAPAATHPAREEKEVEISDPVTERIEAYCEGAGLDPATFASGLLRRDARSAFRWLPPGMTADDVFLCTGWLRIGWHGQEVDRLTPAAVVRALPGWMRDGRPDPSWADIGEPA